MPIEVACLTFLLFTTWVRGRYREDGPWPLRILFGCTLLTAIEWVVSMLTDGYGKGIITTLARPVVYLTMVTKLRRYFWLFWRVVWTSKAMVLSIFVYVVYFSWFGYTIYTGTLEGTMYFDSLMHAVYKMFILITTANYPDVMLPAYEVLKSHSLFFFAYTFIGLILIMNLLLAVVQNSYSKAQQEQLIEADILKEKDEAGKEIKTDRSARNEYL
jgi:two pore calcium channel protein